MSQNVEGEKHGLHPSSTAKKQHQHINYSPPHFAKPSKAAQANMKKFHASNEMVIFQCSICREAWPFNHYGKNKPKENTKICRCKKDKTFPKKFSKENNMIPSPVPPELQDLTQFEEMLIARAFPIIQLYTKPKGGQFAYKGHVLTFPQNVQQLANVLPRCPKDLPVILFQICGENYHSKEFTVRRQKVDTALHWLVANNSLYTTVTIDYSRIDNLPENGSLQDIAAINIPTQTDSMPPDQGPQDTSHLHGTSTQYTEISSFLPISEGQQKQKDLIRDQLSVQQPYPWNIERTPLNEYYTNNPCHYGISNTIPRWKR